MGAKMPEKKKTEAKVSARQMLKLRTDFSELILANPNYFGNIPESKFTVKFPLTKSTVYEDISCVGFNPEHDILFATIRIKKDTGYKGGLCSQGSYEYVRFYVDWKGDGKFADVGMARVNVHDIPGPKPLNYCVGLKVDPKKTPCFFPKLVKVRAILSWNLAPPPGQAQLESDMGRSRGPVDPNQTPYMDPTRVYRDAQRGAEGKTGNPG
jgi:hypothetical protein